MPPSTAFPEEAFSGFRWPAERTDLQPADAVAGIGLEEVEDGLSDLFGFHLPGAIVALVAVRVAVNRAGEDRGHLDAVLTNLLEEGF